MRYFLSQKEGSTLPVFGVCLAGVFAVVGMSLAISFDARTGRGLQEVADSSAIAGATAFITAKGGSVDANLQLAYDTAFEFARGNSEDAIKTVDVEAVTTDEYGQHTAITVELEFRPSNAMNRWAGKGESSPVWRRARAIATKEFPLCILSLETDDTGILISGNGSLQAQDCAIWSNSKALNAIQFQNSGSMTAASICAAGQTRGDSITTVTPTPIDACQSIPDPLSSWTAPSPGSCDTVGGLRLTSGGLKTDLSPGTFCGGLWAVADKIELKPGTYFIKDGPLYLNGTDELIGEGVTFILSGTNAKVEIQGDGILRLTAPTSGPLAGIALTEDRSTKPLGWRFGLAPTDYVTSRVTGNGQIEIEGLIYLPTQKIEITGNGWGKKSSPYLQVVARFIEISDLGQLAIDYRPDETSVPIVIEPESYARLVQ